VSVRLTRCLVALAFNLALSATAHAGDYREVLKHSPDQVYDAIAEVMEDHSGVKVLEADPEGRSVRFRYTSFPGADEPWSESFEGIYVKVSVLPDGQGNSIVDFTVTRLYPPFSKESGDSKFKREEEDTFGGQFLKLVQQALLI
jgi:hypothetical protein